MATPPDVAAAAVDYNTGYLKTPAGGLRLAEGLFALAAIISCAEGSVCYFDGGKYGFFIFVAVVSLIHSILILVVIVLRWETKIPSINVPLSLLLNDSIRIIFYFLATILMMLSIGNCREMIGARIVASILGIGGFLTLVGLSYTDYRWWKGEETPYSWNSRGVPPETATPTFHNLS